MHRGNLVAIEDVWAIFLIKRKDTLGKLAVNDVRSALVLFPACMHVQRSQPVALDVVQGVQNNEVPLGHSSFHCRFQAAPSVFLAD